MITFNPEGYKKLLQSLVHNYQVVTFDQAVDIKSSELTGICCLRHDIDYCLNSALKMASVEKDSNIFSSYFFLVDSDYYNVLSERSAAIISEISQMGHEIALHFDIAGYPIEKHSEIINKHVSILESISAKKIKSLSYHNPGHFGMEKICKDTEYHNYFNTYSTGFNENFHYISDSLCSFRDKGLVAKIQNKTISNLHLLIHPIWWGNSIEDRDGKVKFVADSKRDYLLNTYYEVVKAYEFK